MMFCALSLLWLLKLFLLYYSNNALSSLANTRLFHANNPLFHDTVKPWNSCSSAIPRNAKKHKEINLNNFLPHHPESVYSISSTGGRAVCVIGFSCAANTSVTGLDGPLVSSTAIAGRSALWPCSTGEKTIVLLSLLALFISAVFFFALARSSNISACSIFSASASPPLAFSLCRAAAKSSAWTSLFGGSSCLLSQPCGGEGGGEMKKRRPVSGALRCWSSGSTILVSWPK